MKIKRPMDALGIARTIRQKTKWDDDFYQLNQGEATIMIGEFAERVATEKVETAARIVTAMDGELARITVEKIKLHQHLEKLIRAVEDQILAYKINDHNLILDEEQIAPLRNAVLNADNFLNEIN